MRKILLTALLLAGLAPAGAQDYPRYRPAGSAYVPLHSWVYPAIERLAALRYISSDFRGTRPWTRIECARLSQEAGEAIADAQQRDETPGKDVVELQRALEAEFATELDVLAGSPNRSVLLESAYSRVLSLSGPVLNDSYHFGQSVANDFGRPFRRGTNVIAGAAFRGTYGPFFAYGWGEFQHSPSAPALLDSQRALVAQQDQLPVKPAIPFEPVNRFRLLDSYVGVNLHNWQLSFGRQSLWWGTSESGPLLLSNNAEPINMLRLNRVVPFRLPSFLGWFGPIRVDFFVGRLGGHEIASRPWIQGQRLSLKPKPWFEFGATHTAIFGGEGRPNGVDVFFKSLFAFQELRREQRGGESLSDQHLSFDFLFRLGRHATFYSEFLGSDDPYPFSAPTRMAVNTGLYFPRVPWVSRVDLRLEGFYTNSPCEPRCAGGEKALPAGFLHYWHFIYKNGYTNNGNVLGHSIGRNGIGFQAWTTYSFTPQHRLELSFRRNQVSDTFVPSGAQWNDFSVRHERGLKAGFYVRSSLQVESLRYPALFAQPRTNVGVSIEFGFAREMPR